jgi:hypothetical protein
MEQQRPQCMRRFDYSHVNRRDRHVVPIIRDFVLKALNNYPAITIGARALDIGCGEQPFRGDIENAGYRYLGMDVAQNAKRNVDHLGAIDAPLSASVEASEKVQLLLCTEVLEHVADWPLAFTNMRALCVRGAICIISCPFMWELHEEPYDFWRPTLHAIELLAHGSGFECIELRKGGSTGEVISTVLGSITIVQGAGPFSAVRRTMIALLRAALQRIAVSPVISIIGPVESNMYLCNLVVLRAV